MRWRVPASVAAGAGASLAGAGLALRRRARVWRAAPAEVEEAGLTLPADVRHHVVVVDDGGAIHVVERGEGPAVVLVHGVTLGVETWIPQLRALGTGHRVIAVGQRGHGRSSAGSDGYALERLADDLLEVLRALDVRDAVLVGHSMGGMVAQLLAVRRPDDLRRHVASLVLVATASGPMVPGPGPVGSWWGTVMAAMGGLGLRHAERRGRGVLPGDAMATWLTRITFGSRPAPVDVELARTMIGRMSPAAMSALLPPLLAFDVHRDLGTVDLRTLVVAGTRDALTPPHTARALAGAIPGAELALLDGCGHMVMLERAEELNDLLRVASGTAPAAR